MEQIIFTSVRLDQLQNLFSEAIRNELNKFQPPAPPDKEKYITRKETAQILGVSLVTIHSWTKTGLITGYRIGTRIRFKESEILESLNKVQTLKYRRTA
jgi:excisionase family DNA binding protein